MFLPDLGLDPEVFDVKMTHTSKPAPARHADGGTGIAMNPDSDLKFEVLDE